MRIVILFDWRMEWFLCFIGPKDSHPNFNWMAIHAQILIGSRKDEETIDWSKGFGEAFIGQGKISSRRSWRLTKEGRTCVFLGRKEKEEENEVWGRLLVLMCGGVHGRVMEKNEAWNGMELCVASNRGKASGLLVWLIISLKSTVGSVLKLDQF